MSVTVGAHRQAQLDREIEQGRVKYELTLARVRSDGYREEMLLALARIADILNAPKGERADFQALMMIGRIAEVVERFGADQALLDRYEGLKRQRRNLEEMKP